MSAVKYISSLTVFSVFAALISIVFQAFIALKKLNFITTVLTVLLSIESGNKRALNEKANIAIAYGACSDLLISGVNFLNYTEQTANNTTHAHAATNAPSEEITNLNELLQSFAYYFQNGAAAERYVSNKTLFDELIVTAKAQNRIGKQEIAWFLGGNAALMAVRFHLDGATNVLLGAQMSKKLRRLVPDSLQITGEPLTTEDEIHLILEYKAGDQWGNLIAPRANRFILHSDRYNPQLQVAEKFGETLKLFEPHLFVVTGLHVMDKYKFEAGVREARLLKVQEQVALQNHKHTLTHFEMASYVDVDLILMIYNLILPYVDSLGMNEQELANLIDILNTGASSTKVNNWNPEIAVTLDQTREIFQKLASVYYKKQHKVAIGAEKRLLSRVHVHTLAYQIILTRKDSKWKSGKAAAAKASLIAHRYVCQTEMISPESAEILLPEKFHTTTAGSNGSKQTILLNAQNPVNCWNEFIEIDNQPAIAVEICIAPVLVCRIAKKAAGAGDNISAAALLQQI